MADLVLCRAQRPVWRERPGHQASCSACLMSPWKGYFLDPWFQRHKPGQCFLTFVSYVSGMKALDIFPRKCQKFACHSFRGLRKPVDHRSGFTVWNPVSSACSRAPPRLIISESQRMRPRNLNLKQMAQVPSMHMRDREVADSELGP